MTTIHVITDEVALVHRANALFPHTAYLDASAVRAARIGWVKSVQQLRSVAPSRWVCDRPLNREGAAR